jgi:hypothetical protein
MDACYKPPPQAVSVHFAPQTSTSRLPGMLVSPYLSAQGKPRDLRDFSPIPADTRLYCAPLDGAPDVPSEMPLRGSEEHESAFFVQYPLFRATFEGSADATSAAPMGMKMS